MLQGDGMLEEHGLFSVINAHWQDCSDGYSFRSVRSVYIFHYIVRGSGWFETGGRTYRLEQGCIFLIYPGEPFYYHPDPDDPYTYKWVDFYGKLVPDLISSTGFAENGPVSPPLPQLEADFDRLIANKNPLLASNPHLLELFSHMIEVYPTSQTATYQQNLAMTAREYMLANLHKSDFRVQHVADMIGVSRSCLWRMFREQFGSSPVYMMIEERMNNAKRLLASGELVKTTAAACGFEDQVYFSLAFKKRCGISPEAYRMKHMKSK